MRSIVTVAYLFFPLLCSAQTTMISTFAGRTWIYPGASRPALQAPIGPPGGFAYNSKGELFVSDRGNNVVFRIEKGGDAVVVAGNGLFGFSGDGGQARNAAFRSPWGLAFDSEDNLFIADSQNNRIRRVTPDGTISTVAGGNGEGYSGDGGPGLLALFRTPRALAMGPDNVLYILDHSNGRIRSLSADGVLRLVAGTGISDSTGDGGAAVFASIRPRSLTTSPDGILYFSEFDGQRVRSISRAGMIQTVAGNGVRGPAVINGLARNSPLLNPHGISFDKEGNLYIAESNANRILRIDTAGRISRHAGSGEFRSTPDGPALSTGIGGVFDLIVDSSGAVSFEDHLCRCLREVTSEAGIRTFAGNRLFFAVEDGTPRNLAYFNSPQGLTFDRSGNLFVVDRGLGRVAKISPEGAYTHFAGASSGAIVEFEGDGRKAVETRLSDPCCVAVDSQGQVYIADPGVNRIRRVDSHGIMSTFAGTGATASTGDTGPAARAAINGPRGMVFDADGGLIFAEFAGHRIRRIDANGVIRTLAGNGHAGFAGDNGPAASASLNAPTGVALLPGGDLLFTDRNNHRVRKISPDGRITTFAGTGLPGSIGDGGPAVSAQLNRPNDIAVDSEGNVFILENGSIRVRRISTAGQITTLAGTGVARSAGDGGPAHAASFGNLLYGIVFQDGNLFISDQFALSRENSTGLEEGLGGRVRVIEPAQTTFTPSVTSLSFSVPEGSDSAAAPLAISSNRTGLTVTASKSEEWLKLSAEELNAPGSIQVTASARNLRPGAYSATLTLNAELAVPRSRTVNVDLTVTPVISPRLSVSPPSITQRLEASETERAQIRVTNAGSGILAFASRIEYEGRTGWLSAVFPSGSLTAGQTADIVLTTTPRGLPAGTHTATVTVTSPGQPDSRVRVSVFVIERARPRILLSQAGFTFTAVMGGGLPAPQDFAVLNEGGGVMPFNARAITLSGGDWLRLSREAGTVTRPLLDEFLEVTTDHRRLDPGEYFGRIEVTSASDNSPQVITILLKVLPPGSTTGPDVRPSGLVFTTVEGAEPGSQTIRVTNLRGGPRQFASTPSTFDRSGWLQLSPDVGVTAVDTPGNIIVQPALSDLAPGARFGAITLQFGDTGETKTVQVLSVVAPRVTAASKGKPERFLAGCTTPNASLRVQYLSLENGFVAVAGEPTDIRVRILDDCGIPLSPQTAPNPAVMLTDESRAETRLSHVGNGEWRGTWRPRFANEQSTVSLFFIAGDLTSDAAILLRTGRVLSSTTDLPDIRQGALRHSATLQTNVPVAPGSLISILGSGLAQKENTSASLPHPFNLDETQVLLGGRPLALLYTSPGQINAQIPYDVPANMEQQVTVQRGRSLSVPEKFVVAPVQPGILTVNERGFGQGFVMLPDGTTVADSRSPAVRGSDVIIYCTGLGAVTPSVEAGAAVPSGAATVITPLRVIMGGRDAAIRSAILSPRVPGRYEVRVTVPANAPTGNEIPVSVLASDITSQVVTMAIR